VILAVEGREIAPGANYYALLNHQTGKEIDLAIARGGPRGRRETVTIEPAAGGRIWELLYEQWTERSRRRVDELSQGLLGYVHMDAMGAHDWDRLIEDIFSRAQGKQGLILDVRNNNGGSIHDQVLTLLGRRPYVYSRARGDRDITYDAMWRVDGPVVLMTNERSFSDGEIFPAGFRTLGLGRIVGMPTFGGVIGTHDTRLIDGTGFRVPGTGWYRLDGTPLENRPVEPDLRVPSVPEENLRDADAQLEAAPCASACACARRASTTRRPRRRASPVGRSDPRPRACRRKAAPECRALLTRGRPRTTFAPRSSREPLLRD